MSRSTKSSKRNSLLFDVSSSIFSALTSSTHPTITPTKSSPLSTVPSSLSTSLLDDEPDTDGLGAVLVPSVVNSSPAPPPSEPAQDAFDDEEWNW
jgi:hypothetical protein